MSIRRVRRTVLLSLVSLAMVASSWVGTASPSVAQSSAYCKLSEREVAEKEQLRQLAFQGDRQAQDRYRTLVSQHAQQLRDCRTRTWPQEQALWVRLYPCDAQPGAIEALMDEVVNKGYNFVYVETLYNGQILLPSGANPTAWPSVIRTPGYENRDLLAEAIAAGRDRGLTVYAWMFTMNFGYTYSQRSDRQSALAVNGWGNTSLTARSQAGINSDGGSSEEVFIDPYSITAKQDFYLAVDLVAQRRPDGILFDYIRYPRGAGTDSVADEVQDLWIYSPASRQTLLQRALNQRGRDLIERFLNQGYITNGDINSVKSLHPQEAEPLWQGRMPSASIANTPTDRLRPLLQQELWYLAVAHAMQGVIDFLAVGTMASDRHNVPGGAVFFPDGNQTVGRMGYDSRLQPWDRFPASLEWHPMSYATCGNATCITNQVLRVVQQAAPSTQVKPVLAGVWGSSLGNRPSLEEQMQSIRQSAPRVNAISHFAYSWQEPQRDRERKFCQLR
jgi:hypothetical protein